MSTLFDPNVSNADPEYYALLRTEYKSLRDFVDRMWVEFQPLADRDYHIDFPVHFNQRYWEMYLACSLIERGFKLKSASAGPDLQFEHDGKACWIEAIAPTAGVGADAVPQVQYDYVARFVPEEAVILRLCSAFDAKVDKYQRYLRNSRVRPIDPYVIAISGAGVPYSELDSWDLPYVLSTVLPFGGHYVLIDKKTRRIVDQGVQHRPGIAKSSGSVVPTTYFDDPAFSGISAVLYARPTVWSLTRLQLGDLLYVIHNPLAANPLPRGVLPVAVEFWIEDGQLKREPAEMREAKR